MAELQFLEHIPYSPWYGLGERDPYIDVTLPPTDQPEQTTKLAEQEPEKLAPKAEANIEQADTFIQWLNGFAVSPRELDIAEQIWLTGQQQRWFQRRHVDFSTIAFTSDAARNQAFSQLTQRLVEARLLIAEKERAARQYQLVWNAPETILEAVSAAAEPKALVPAPAPEPTPEPRMAPTASLETAPTAEVSTVRPEQPDSRRAIHFADVLVQGISRVLSTDPTQRSRITKVNQILSEEFRVNPELSRSWISDLVIKGHFHFEASSGVRYLVAGAGEKNGKQKNPQSSLHSTAEKEALQAWQAEDIDNAFFIANELLKLKHVQQGVEPRDLIRILGIPAEREEAFRRSIRRIEAHGYFYINPKANPNTRSDHSKKLFLPVVMFKTQAIKLRFKDDPRALRKEMEALIGSVPPRSEVTF